MRSRPASTRSGRRRRPAPPPTCDRSPLIGPPADQWGGEKCGVYPETCGRQLERLQPLPARNGRRLSLALCTEGLGEAGRRLAKRCCLGRASPPDRLLPLHGPPRPAPQPRAGVAGRASLQAGLAAGGVMQGSLRTREAGPLLRPVFQPVSRKNM